ncbi:hypothetical protein BC939DRAFT_173922 [Gamsiella multidivaricata]|uniref:uncharacterized protein n=1 Tax=Gamsiella multidivaricata TaxID=101098 RepID=UPI0022204B97|nr:uncharacterized protein BC939DRAFT_173922 [Gamsiella multidivaricata]KAI7822932.1 hypothetical protein BC939DRAFT_173922 [Gamsiella multidivaricata]
MDDFDIELDIMDMMNDDSPVKLKANEVAGFVGSGQPVLRRSGSLTRSTSSPVLTQTTKAMPTLQKPQKLNLQPLKVPNTTVGTSTSMSPAFGDNPFAPKQTMFSISSTASPSTAFCPPKPPASSAPLSTKQDTSQKNQKAPVNMPQNQKHWDSKDSSSPSPQNLVGAQIPPTMNGTKNIYRANSLAASAANAINSSDSASSLNQHSTTHNYRVPAPSAVHQSMYLTNPVQGTGLKRPLGTGR